MEMLTAFLGPWGTYTHQAAHERFGDDCSYVEKETISDVFSSLSEVDHGVVPHINSTFGPVEETYNILHERRDDFFVCDELSMSIEHCLLVRRGVCWSDIQCIMSHEQALGQCQNFISANFPSASLRKTTSTAAAAQDLLSDDFPRSAAICSKLCATLIQGLQVLRSGIQDNIGNYTKFYVLTSSSNKHKKTYIKKALVRAAIDCQGTKEVEEFAEGVGMKVTAIVQRTVDEYDTCIVHLAFEAPPSQSDTIDILERKLSLFPWAKVKEARLIGAW